MVLIVLLFVGAFQSLVAQEIEKPIIAPAAASAAATPAPSSEKKRGVFIDFSTDDEKSISAEMREKLSPEQIYKLELARIETRSETTDDSSVQHIVVPLGFFAMIVAIVVISVWSRSRRNRLTHETVRLLLEKGQPVPAELFSEGTPKPKSDLRRGLIWSAVGLGIIGYLLADHDSDWGLGFVPLCIGAGYLIAWKIEKRPKSDAGV